MTGVALTVGFDDALLTGHLSRLAVADARGFAAVRHEIGSYLLGEVQDSLDGQKLFDGTAMPQSKAAIKRAGKTLIRKHHLYDSYVYQLTGGGLELGSNLIYAAIHHFGGDAGRGHATHIEARPVMGMTAAHEARIGDVLIDQIRRLG